MLFVKYRGRGRIGLKQERISVARDDAKFVKGIFYRFGGFVLGDIDKKAMNESSKQNAVLGVDRFAAIFNDMTKNLSINVNSNVSYIQDPFDQNRTAGSVIKSTLATMGTEDNVKVELDFRQEVGCVPLFISGFF